MLSNADILRGFKCTLFQMKLLADEICMHMAFERFSVRRNSPACTLTFACWDSLLREGIDCKQTNFRNSTLTYTIQCELWKFCRRSKPKEKERVCLSFELK